MKYLIIFISLLIIKLAFAGDLDENNGPSEYYHQMLHGAEEAYLVRYEHIAYTPGGSNGLYKSKDAIEISAVIEQSFKGQKKINEHILFHRIYDSNISEYLPDEGQRFIVFFKSFNGESAVDPQDPASVWAHSAEIVKFLTEHI